MKKHFCISKYVVEFTLNEMVCSRENFFKKRFSHHETTYSNNSVEVSFVLLRSWFRLSFLQSFARVTYERGTEMSKIMYYCRLQKMRKPEHLYNIESSNLHFGLKTYQVFRVYIFWSIEYFSDQVVKSGKSLSGSCICYCYLLSGLLTNCNVAHSKHFR